MLFRPNRYIESKKKQYMHNKKSRHSSESAIKIYKSHSSQNKVPSLCIVSWRSSSRSQWNLASLQACNQELELYCSWICPNIQLYSHLPFEYEIRIFILTHFCDFPYLPRYRLGPVLISLEFREWDTHLT